MKRFYESAEVAEISGGFAIALDGKTVNTPGRSALSLPTAALAAAVCAEWQAQEEEVEPHTMRLTRLANSAIDRVALSRETVIAEIAGFAAADLLCYRADAPPELVARQSEVWQPVLDWTEHRYRIQFNVTTGITAVEQPMDSLRAIATAVAAFDDFLLAGLHSATAGSGSVMVGLALAEGEIDAETAWSCADLDDAYQAGRWGEDDEATRRRDGLRAEIMAAGEFLALCRRAA